MQIDGADAVMHAELEACGEAMYDAAVLNMVIMDMPDISACAAGLRHVLKASPFPSRKGTVSVQDAQQQYETGSLPDMQ